MVARATADSIDRSALPGQLQRWVARGLISPEQAERILAEEQPAGRPVARGSLVAEGLGYVGGVLIPDLRADLGDGSYRLTHSPPSDWHETA